MTIKKIEDMNCYELLNLEKTATPEDIERAYLLGLASYQPDSLASYSLVPDEERKLVLLKLEEAYQTLGDGEKRKTYDAELFKGQPVYEPKAHFRKSTDRLEIGHVKDTRGFWKKLKKTLFPAKPSNGAGRKKTGPENPSSPEKQALYRGEYLKGVRLNRGLSLEDISKTTRIRVSDLVALEEGNYARLTKGKNGDFLLKLYARSLGLNTSG